MAATNFIILLAAFACLANLAGLEAAKSVRIALQKGTSMKAGHLGQPATNYFARTEFGTPPKPFNMLIDVNARESWLPQDLTMGWAHTKLNHRDGYRQKDSNTSIKQLDATYLIEYQGCALEGKAYRDVLSFKDVLESLLPVRFEQRFLAMFSASNDKFRKSFPSADGVLAFSPWPISETGSDMVCVAMNRANLTGGLVIGLELDSDLDSPQGGELTIGGLDALQLTGELRFHRLAAQHSWEVSLQSVVLGANQIDACPGVNSRENSCTAVLSTTANDIMGPEAAIKPLLALLGVYDTSDSFKSSALYKIDCDQERTAPNLTFVIDGAHYTVPAASYIKKRESGILFFKSTSCYVSLLATTSDHSWTLGTNFLSNYYTVLDMDKQAAALGQRK